MVIGNDKGVVMIELVGWLPLVLLLIFVFLSLCLQGRQDFLKNKYPTQVTYETVF